LCGAVLPLLLAQEAQDKFGTHLTFCAHTILLFYFLKYVEIYVVEFIMKVFMSLIVFVTKFVFLAVRDLDTVGVRVPTFQELHRDRRRNRLKDHKSSYAGNSSTVPSRCVSHY
jgi:hypothetical protein